MGFRIVFIENEVELKVKLDTLVIRKDNKDIFIPIDDISMLVIDSLQIKITTRLFCILASHNVGIILCNQEHMPIGYYSSYDNHSRISKSIKYQINKSEEFYGRLWCDIVRAKIENQANVLDRLDKDRNVIENIHIFGDAVTEGDTTNREAHAAKIYFNELMGTSFSRGNDDILINSGLDYGYAILRSFLAKCCVSYGLNSQLGIHHCNEYNRFNLVDDLIEPFRPFVDYYVYGLLKDEEYFKGEHRHKLVNLLNHKMMYKKKKMYLCNAIEEYVTSVAAFICEKDVIIEYPDISGYIGEEDEI